MPSVDEAKGFRLVAPKSLGKVCTYIDVGDGVDGKAVLAGVVATMGWTEAQTDGTIEELALGDGSSDRISSMHNGWTKLARFCKSLPPIRAAACGVGASTRGSSMHKLSAKLIKLRFAFVLAGSIT
jgi:hypothetical protein